MSHSNDDHANGDQSSDQFGNQSGDQVIIRDRAGRRRFIRNGAAFLVASSTLSAQQAAFADDCDRNRSAEKSPDDATSDSDIGASADAPGCGKQPKAKITRYQDNEVIKKTSA